MNENLFKVFSPEGRLIAHHLLQSAAIDIQARAYLWLAHLAHPKTEKLIWHYSMSFIIPFMVDLTGKKIPPLFLPVAANLYAYMRESDDLSDGESFPTRAECMEKTGITHVRLLDSIYKLSLDQGKNTLITSKLAELADVAYDASKNKQEWTGIPTFSQAYNYRLATTGFFSQTVAEILCLASGVSDNNKKKNTADALVLIGMIFQYVDDLMDFQEDCPKKDKPSAGNLIIGLLNDNKEYEAFKTAINSITSHELNALELLAAYSDNTRSELPNKINKELDQLAVISVKVASVVRGIVYYMLPRIIILK